MSDLIDILIVDDEVRNLDALEATLERPGYRLLRATSGDEALRLLLKNDVAAIILDIRMPGLSGLELAQLVKSNRRFSEVPIMLLTAHVPEERDVMEGYGAGAVDYLTKPVNPIILRHKIGQFVELFRRKRELAELNATLERRVKERTAELEASEAALKASARQKDEFLATLAHELRNPLAPLRMGLDLLLRAEPRLEAFERTLLVMNRQLVHMVRLIDDLLDVARISGGSLELQRESADLAKCIQTALDTCAPFFERRRQQVSFEPAVPSLIAFVDSTRVVQIINNLLHNASKFSPEGGRIVLTLRYEDGEAVVRVVDSGVGLAPEQIPRVFDMFVRLQSGDARPAEGLGIGLALARRLAELHGGTLEAASAGLGQGSTFTLRLAAEGVGLEPTKLSERPPPLPATEAGGAVVVVEDNVDAADMLRAWLEEQGHQVSVARAGPEGLELIQLLQPRAVICDIGLPGMDGVEVCRRVRASSLPSQPLMIALTGWGMEQDRLRTQETGFDHHLVKPVDPDTLFALLRSRSGEPAQ